MTDFHKKATRNDVRNLQQMPLERAGIDVARVFSREEYEKLSEGLVSRSMDEKWIVSWRMIHLFS